MDCVTVQVGAPTAWAYWMCLDFAKNPWTLSSFGSVCLLVFHLVGSTSSEVKAASGFLLRVKTLHKEGTKLISL